MLLSFFNSKNKKIDEIDIIGSKREADFLIFNPKNY